MASAFEKEPVIFPYETLDEHREAIRRMAERSDPITAELLLKDLADIDDQIAYDRLEQERRV